MTSILQHLSRTALALGATAPTSLAQSGQFVPGDLYFFTTAFGAVSDPYHKPLMRIDPVTGAAQVITDWPQAYSSDGGVVYDAFRDRIVMMGHPTASAPTPLGLYLVDALGTWTDLGFSSRGFRAFAPGGGGRIYAIDGMQGASGPALRYLDASNQEHVVLDAIGATHYQIAATSLPLWMVWDEGENALFTAHSSSIGVGCAAGVQVAVLKHPLSSDGSRVVGPTACASIAVGTSAGTPVGFCNGPNGLLLTIDTNSSAVEPHVLNVDPVTLAITPYASFGYLGSAALGAGTYSSVRQQAIVLDTFNDDLRAFGPGTGGTGTDLGVSFAVSSAGSAGEKATLFEIPQASCGTNNVALYCTAKTSSSGCAPAISTLGGPSVSLGHGFTIRCNDVEKSKPGLFFYGTHGPFGAPFQGAFLCVKPPTKRLAVQNSGGTLACGGSLVVDFNAWIAQGSDPALTLGRAVHGQFWFRDLADPTSGTGLSGGVSFTLCD